MVSVVFCRRHRCVLFRSFQSKMHQKQNFFQKPRSAPSSSFRNNLDVLRGNERSASWKAILRNPSRKCQEIWESIPQQTTKRRNYQFIRSCWRFKVRSDPKYPERLDFPSLNFYREKRKKIPGFFFFLPMVKNGTSYEASWEKECFDRKKSPTILKVSMKLSAILSTDQFESLVGQRKKRKFVNSIINFSNIRLSLWRRCCLTKGLVVFKRKSAKKHRPS